MRLLFILSFLAVMSLLSGCGPIYQTTYSYVPPQSRDGKMCTIQCQQNQAMCQQSCSATADSCRNNARQQAIFSYHEYKQRRRAEGKPVNKTVDNFYSDYQCNTDCGCANNYNSCFTMCGGQIIPHSTCVAFCNKAK